MLVNCPLLNEKLLELEKNIINSKQKMEDNNNYKAISLCDDCLTTMNKLLNKGPEIGKASKYCYQNAYEKSKGKFSAHARDALNHAGFDFPSKNFDAYKFHKDENGVKHLELRGFKEIPLEEG